MLGRGVVQGMLVTLRHFFQSYLGDIKVKGLGRRFRPDAQAVRQSPKERGIFTVQYPEEKLAIPERFRYLPFLLYDPATGEERCTACGICAKVCPPQCIWIVQATKEGKPIPQAEGFWVDMSICMSCGFCAEFCPFDAIKMDHDYELSGYERRETLIYDKEKLNMPVEYYAGIHPLDYATEEEARRKKEEARLARAAPAKPEPTGQEPAP